MRKIGNKKLGEKIEKSYFVEGYPCFNEPVIFTFVFQNNIGFIRLGRSERIHPDLRSYSAELNTLKMTEVEDLAKYYNSSVCNVFLICKKMVLNVTYIKQEIIEIFPHNQKRHWPLNIGLPCLSY